MLFLLMIYGVLASMPHDASDSTTRVIVERGIESHGGEKQLARPSKPWRARIKGIAGKLEITGEIVNQSPTRSKISTEVHLGPLSTEAVVVLDGDKGWRRVAGFTNEVTGKELEEMQDGGYRHHVRNLVPLLREPGFNLSELPDAQVSGHPATGIRVQSKGHRNIDLYFDKGTGLVVKTESRIDAAGKPPIVLEQILSNYRDFDGLKLATKFTKFENHKQTSVEEYVDVKFVDHIDDSEFKKP